MTIDTPHNGSEMADFFSDILEDYINGIYGILGRSAFIDLDLHDPDAFPFLLIRPDGGGILNNEFELSPAVADLKVVGGTRFGVTPVPTHLVAGDLLPGAQNLPDVPEEIFTVLRFESTFLSLMKKVMFVAKFFGTSGERLLLEVMDEEGLSPAAKAVRYLNYMLRGYQSVSVMVEGDGVVSVSSQTAGLGRSSPPKATIEEGIQRLHMGVPLFGIDGAIVSACQLTGHLLNEPAESARFGLDPGR